MWWEASEGKKCGSGKEVQMSVGQSVEQDVDQSVDQGADQSMMALLVSVK